MQPQVTSPGMSPPFQGKGGAAMFAAVVAVFLLLPILLHAWGLPPKFAVYRGITLEAGRFPYLGRLVTQDKGDIDLLFFGSSLVRASVDVPMVEQALREAGHGDPVVRMGGVNWPGLDMQYFLLRDLLERRRVKRVVLSMAVGQQDTVMPHVQLFRFLRWGDYADVFDGLTWRQGASLYGVMVLGAPRQALTLARHNRVSDWSGDVTAPGQPRTDELGYYGARFVRVERRPPVIPAREMIYEPGGAGKFRFLNRRPNDYQWRFLLRLAGLLRQHHVQVLFLNTPMPEERDNNFVQERLPWMELFGPGTRVIGVAPARLFAGMSEEDLYLHYYDQHLNRNGREYFTRAILPAMLAIYGEGK